MAPQSTFRFLTSLAAPGGVLVLAAWALEHEPVVREATAPYAIYFCFGSLAAAVLLSWYYEQSRLLCSAAAAMLTVSAWVRAADPPGVAALAIVLLPLNFALFAVLRERGVLSLEGLFKAALVAAQAFGVVWLAEQHPDVVRAIVQWGERAVWLSGLSLAAGLSFAMALSSLVALVLVRRTKVEQGLLWTSVATFLGIRATTPEGVFIFCGAAGLILVLAVLEHGYDIAYRDELTGLPGRRAFNHAIEQLGGAYTIAMCDVDHFKRFNDSYGHEAGDQLLKLVASQLSHVGGGGRAFRYGGEEFLIVFRGRTAREAEPFAEFLRRAIGGLRIVPRGTGRPFRSAESARELSAAEAAVSITISIGLGEKSMRHSTPELVLEAADAALYRAKEAGRNCVRIAEGTPA
jgi:diguanylate cyclase (GGDEF)-like protein